MTANGTLFAVREGATGVIGGTARKVKSFVGLQALPSAAGQGRGVTPSGVLARVKLDDGTHAILRVALGETGLIATEIAQSGDVLRT